MKTAPLAVAALMILVASCQTAQPPIAADAPSEIYFQRAQAASDQNQYDEALGLYQSFLAQRPDASREDVFSARYEIGLLMLKKGDKAQAQADFQSLVSDYDDLEKSSGAPGWVKVLATKKLQELKDQATKTKG